MGDIDKTKENKKRRYKKKKSRALMKSVLTILVAAIIAGILFITYKIQSNGGGLSGVVATVLGESKRSHRKI